MKFKNPNLMVFVWTDEYVHGWTSPKQYAPSTFSKLGGGHKNGITIELEFTQYS